MHVRSQRNPPRTTVLPPPRPVLVRTDAAATRVPEPRIPNAVEQSRRAYVAVLKPLLDRLAAAALLVLFAPVLLVVAVVVLVTLGRPVLLRQDRVGVDGSVFTLLKFRTMHPCRRTAADRRRPLTVAAVDDRREHQDRRRTHKHPHDPRLVPAGRFLRKWSLDELPQLVNVLRGEMSLVGPRPELPAVVDTYEPWQHERHVVRPGITGLWQVSDRGSDGVLMHERTDVDLHYVRRVSFWFDLTLLLATVPAVLGLRRGV